MKKLLVLLALSLTSAAAPDKYRIVPGQGFGPFTGNQTVAQLEKLVRPEEFGTDETGVTLYFMDPLQRVAVTLDKKKHVRSMQIHGSEGVWHTAEGIGLGTPLSRLEKLNGRPFLFRSLGTTDDAGRITDWRGGKLAKLLAKTELTFAGAMHAKGYNGLNDAEHQQAEADGKVMNSSHPLARKLNPIVETITLTFP